MIVIIIVILYCLIVFAQSCTRSLPAYDSSSFTGGNFSHSGGIQLLIPSSNFTCQGAINEWTAHVTGNTAVSDSIEFQIFEPAGDGVYRLKHGNSYIGNKSIDSMITRPVNTATGPFIPIRPGDIVGVYLPPSIANLGLLYDGNGDDDVLYWDNLADSKCNYSLCSGKSIRSLNILVGWKFSE